MNSFDFKMSRSRKKWVPKCFFSVKLYQFYIYRVAQTKCTRRSAYWFFNSPAVGWGSSVIHVTSTLHVVHYISVQI
jgi:hypothetical protein